MWCDDVRRQLDAYLSGALGEEERAAVEEHLGRCEECRKELEIARHLPATRIVNTILQQAIRNGADEIAFEPVPLGLAVVSHKGDTAQELMRLPRYVREAIIAGVEHMADMGQSIREGHISVHWENRRFRADVVGESTPGGERLVIRLSEQLA